jgi:hypothetical protein
MSRRSSIFRASVGVLGLLGLCAVVLVYVHRASPVVLTESAFEFAYQGNAVADMRFSPDGRKISLVTFETEDHLHTPPSATRIYKVPQGTLDHELPGGAWKSAWTNDGLILASPRRDAREIDLWDTRSWTVRQTVPVTYPKSLYTKPEVLRLCFDATANLYIAEFEYGFEDYGFGTKLEYSPRVWWNLGDHWGPKDELFGTCVEPSPYSDSIAPQDLAVSAGPETLVAFTSFNCAAEILKLRTLAEGKRSLEPKIGLRLNGAIKLTPGGEYLIVFGPKMGEEERLGDGDATEDKKKIVGQVRVLHLLADRAELITTRTVAALPPRETLAPEILDVAHDGKLAAICTRRRFEVVRIPSCETVVEIPKRVEHSAAICFTPDGKFLAVDDRDRHTIRFYRMP